MVLSVAKYGHQFAMSAASSGLTPAASLSEVFTGITQVRTNVNLCTYSTVHQKGILHLHFAPVYCWR